MSTDSKPGPGRVEIGETEWVRVPADFGQAFTDVRGRQVSPGESAEVSKGAFPRWESVTVARIARGK